jgi:hypothetical protein
LIHSFNILKEKEKLYDLIKQSILEKTQEIEELENELMINKRVNFEN